MRALFTAGVLLLFFGLCFARKTEPEVGTQRLPTPDVLRIIQRSFIGRRPDQTRSQFAVLALVPNSFTTETELTNLLAIRNGPVLYSFMQPTYDRTRNRRVHAEELVLRNSATLTTNYANSIYGRYRIRYTSFLYTWIHPCPGCANLIINNANSLPGLNVGYTTQGESIHPPLTQADRNLIRNSLINAGMTLTRVRYPQNLLYGSESEEEEQ